MREIIFRGKRIDNGKWVEGYLLSYEDGRARICERGTDIFCYERDDSIIQTVAHEVIPETVGQFTGLTDKNGVRIFEGDICQIKNHRLIDDTPFVVEWEGFVYNGWTWRDLVDDSEDSFTNGAAKVCEVIGNIHDNPELLGE